MSRPPADEATPTSDSTSDSTSDDAGRSEAIGTARFEVVRTEAHRTLDEQLDQLEDADTKALRLLKFTTALLGVVVSLFSFLGRDLDGAANGYLLVGVGLFAVATVAAGVTYAVSARVVGVGPRDLDRAVGAGSAGTVRRTLARSYADWIQYNAVATARSAVLVATTILLVVSGSLSLVLGVLRTTYGPLPLAVPVAAVGLVVFASYATRLHRQVGRLLAVEPPAEETDPDRDLTDAAARLRGQTDGKDERRIDFDRLLD